MPRISVVIPTFNCERFLRKAINSALAQTYRDFEIILVDDGSTDGTQALVAEFGTSVCYISQSNQGVSAARNLALSKASGEFIAYLDADDMWNPEKLALQVEFLDAHPNCGFVHSEVAVIDEQDNVLHARFNQETGRAVPQGQCTREILLRCHIQTLTVVERRRAFDRVGGFDWRMPVAQDYLHWILVVLQGYEVGYIPHPLGQYRWRAGSLMASQRRLLKDFVTIYKVLLIEKRLERTHGEEVAEVVKRQLYSMQRKLAYIERVEGSQRDARQRLWNLIQEHPFQLELYVDLAKTYILPTEASSRMFHNW